MFASIVGGYSDKQPAMTGGALEDFMLQLTRIGWDNPLGRRRGEIQRVAYSHTGDELWRDAWSVIDRLNDEESQQRVLLLSGVTDVQLRFLSSQSRGVSQTALGDEWLEAWPDNSKNEPLPRAVELVLNIDGFGEIKRIVEVVGS